MVGPRAGGTRITIVGVNLLSHGNYTVMIGNEICPVSERSDRTIICTSRALKDPDLLNKSQEVLAYRFYDGVPIIIKTRPSFVYGKDPEVTSVSPLESILSGGVPLTVQGSGLTSVKRPVMLVTAQFKGVTMATFETICEVANASRMICITPSLEVGLFAETGELNVTKVKEREWNQISASGQPAARTKRHLADTVKSQTRVDNEDEAVSETRHRRSAEYSSTNTSLQVNNKTIDLYLGFRFDGAKKYEDMRSVLREYSKITAYINPEVERWQDRLRDFRPFPPFNHRAIDIKGHHLATGIGVSAYTITVGSGKCVNLSLASKRITCHAPTSRPAGDGGDTTGPCTVLVHVGVASRIVKVGELNYQMTLMECPPVRHGVIGGCVAVVIVLLVITSVVVLRKNSASRTAQRNIPLDEL